MLRQICQRELEIVWLQTSRNPTKHRFTFVVCFCVYVGGTLDDKTIRSLSLQPFDNILYFILQRLEQSNGYMAVQWLHGSLVVTWQSSGYMAVQWLHGSLVVTWQSSGYMAAGAKGPDFNSPVARAYLRFNSRASTRAGKQCWLSAVRLQQTVIV